MADLSFHHGSRVFNSNETPLLLRTTQSAVIAIPGTAPDADLSVFPYNRPVLIKGPNEMSKIAKLGSAGTLKDAADDIFDQIGTYLYILNIEEGANWEETLSNMVGDAATLTGVHALKKCESLYGRHLKPRLVAASGFTHKLATDGIASVNITVHGSGYSVNPAITVNGDGSGAEAKAVVVDGAIDSIVITKPGYGYTGTPSVAITDETGTGATATASIGITTNPVVAELAGILAELRAHAYIDGPSTTDEAAVLYRETVGSKRFYICDPRALVWDTELDANVPRFSSSRFAGVQARVDRTLGFNHSVSNKKINGITGIERPIAYGLQTDYLNENHVNTIVNFGDGYRTWGNRSASGESLEIFQCVNRTMDFIAEAIEAAALEFTDKLNTPANLKFIIEGVAAFMRLLEGEGYLVRGSGQVWFDRERNTPETMAAGKTTFGYRCEPFAPMEDNRFIAHRNVEAYVTLINGVISEVDDGNLALAA